MNYAEALAELDRHINLERIVAGRRDAPSLDAMRRLVHVLGDPHHAFPVVHVTGTNGKGSTVQLVTRLLMAHGLTVGTYTSPHLERVNERLARNGEPIDDETFATLIGDLVDLELVAGVRASYFELLTAAAFRWFAEEAVDVGVIEVGMLGRWDATNVVDARVAVVTNVGLDHTEYAGPTRAHIAREKAGIVKPGSTLVLGETDPELAAIFRAEPHAAVVERDLDFAVVENTLALGGRLLDLRTPMAIYPEVFLSLHGAHQGDNAVAALTAVESFFDAPVDPEVLQEAFADVTVPGRLEVLGHQPLVVVDGAHNAAGIEALVQAFDDEFDVAGERIVVVGFLRGRDPAELLDLLEVDRAGRVVVCSPESPRAVPAEEVAAVARRLGADVEVVDDVRRACDRALAVAGESDAVLVTGSLYVVGAARSHLRSRRRAG